MSNTPEAFKLAALAKALPGQIQAAAQAVECAERCLADALIARATGQEIKPSEIAVARMTLARAQRNVEDLQRIQDSLPATLEQARIPALLASRTG